tara:strand:+ start:685 stop:1560 length:876 start_codon:yes stop_codon:yes gene_type:complete
MCSASLTPLLGSRLGFGLGALKNVFGFFSGRRDTARDNRAIAIQNQLLINAYNTKNRNEENIWNNNKSNIDIAVDNKWRESQNALAEAQMKAREVAGQAAIAQQRILAKMLSTGGREQTGRRVGRKNIAELGAQLAAAGAQAAFAKESEILFTDKVGRNMAAFAQGKYVEYITGRPSPDAPPILQQKKSGPSFLNTALSIASGGLKSYQDYQNTKAPQITQSGNPFNFSPQPQPLPSYGSNTPVDSLNVQFSESPVSFKDQNLQNELDNYFQSGNQSASDTLNFGAQLSLL